jgi:small subunit ribosomal protein S6
LIFRFRFKSKTETQKSLKEAVLDTKRQYEVVFIADPEADEDEVQRLTDTFKQLVTDQGGVINRAEPMGRRQLAYEILHKTEGTFVLMEIEGSGSEIAELERRMRVNDRILRYLTVRVDEDRRRAEKFKSRRAAKAARKGKAAGASGGGTPSQTFSGDDEAE